MAVIASLWNIFCFCCGALVSLSLAIYLLPLIYLSFLQPQNLKKKYNASWALITGGSSGIGLALAHRLASQGLSLVIVARDDHHLPTALAALRREYPVVRILSVAADLSKDAETYMDAIRKVTDTLPIAVVCSNAGYLPMAYFHAADIEAHIANYECNLLAAVRIAHHFYSRMLQERRKGAIVFTSSAAFFLVSYVFLLSS